MRGKASFLSLALLMTAGGLGAQSLMVSDGDIFVVPSNVTSAGKPVMGVIENKEAVSVLSLLDDGLNVEKSINVQLEQLVTSYWIEESDTLKPERVEAGEPYLRPGYGEVWMPDTIDISAIPTPDSLAVLVQSIYGGKIGNYVGYYDVAGRMSVCNYGDGWNFWNYELYGTEYPYHYWCVIDGKLWDYIQPYEFVYDTENITWTATGWQSEAYDYCGVEPVMIMDYDSNALPAVGGLYVSQTLFGTDDKWEYVLPMVEYDKNYRPETDSYSDGVRRVLSRVGCSFPKCAGFMIVTEDGDVAAVVRNEHNAESMYLESVLRVAGNVYLLVVEDVADEEGGKSEYQTLYAYDQSASAVRAISTVRRGDCFATVENGVVTVNVDEGMADSDVVISGTSGQTVANAHISSGQTSALINASQLPKGVYNVTLSRGGVLLGNQKLFIAK